MRIFRRIAEFLNPKQEPPLGLSDAEVLMLKQLLATDEWPIYLKAVDRLCTLYGEQMLLQRDAAELHEARGFVLGLRRAATLINWLTQETNPVERSERSRSNGAGTYGSSYFRRT